MTSLGSLVTRSAQVGDICAVQGQRMTVVDNHLFFMSGSYKIIDTIGNVSEWQKQRSLFSIDLKQPFPVEDLLSADIVTNITFPPELSEVVPDIENQAEASWSGALFPSNESLFIYGSGSSPLFGGGDPAERTARTLARYNSAKQQWSSVDLDGGDFNDDARLLGAVASDPVNGTSFFTGGANNVRGMLRLDASNPERPTWTNSSQGRVINDRSPHVIAGGMVFLPVGKSGALVLLGGANPITFANQTFRPTWMADNKWNMIPMDIVHVYDIETTTWFPITTSTSTSFPSGRTQFCLGVSRAPDDSSFQITMYGGSPYNTRSLDDVWVLSVPSFRWILVNDTDNHERMSDGPEAGRNGHTCVIWRDSQLIVLGGIYARPAATKAGSDRNVSVCDTTYSPIRLLDTSTYAWKSAYSPDLGAYKVPSVVSDVIGGDFSGKATFKEPEGGFNDTRLSALFARTLPRPHGSNGPQFGSTDQSIATGTPSSSNPRAPTTKTARSTPWPIVGGVIGASIAFTVLVWIGWYYYKRERRTTTLRLSPPTATRTTSVHTWMKPELHNSMRYELPDECTDPSELPDSMVRCELPTAYQGNQMP